MEAEDLIYANEIWLDIDAFMTDAISKEIKIEEDAALIMKLDHLPYHLLCTGQCTRTWY